MASLRPKLAFCCYTPRISFYFSAYLRNGAYCIRCTGCQKIYLWAEKRSYQFYRTVGRPYTPLALPWFQDDAETVVSGRHLAGRGIKLSTWYTKWHNYCQSRAEKNTQRWTHTQKSSVTFVDRQSGVTCSDITREIIFCMKYPNRGGHNATLLIIIIIIINYFA